MVVLHKDAKDEGFGAWVPALLEATDTPKLLVVGTKASAVGAATRKTRAAAENFIVSSYYSSPLLYLLVLV
jgi:hypothetical protein